MRANLHIHVSNVGMFLVFLQGIVSPHDVAVSQDGDTVYVVAVDLDRKSQKVHKYDVINNNADQGLF